MISQYLNYIKIGIIVLVVATIGILAYQNKGLRADKKALAFSLSTALSANEQQSKTIASLKKQAVLDAERVSKLQTDIKQIAARDLALRDKLHKLEKSNEAVRMYMDTLIPDDVARLLSDESSNEN